MAMISYAQNFEDVMLARALSDVRDGFYVDVGAQDPEEGSVTKHFYDRGWRGLNFEPSAAYYEKVTAARPRDVTLRSAVGAEPGTATFYEVQDTGLSTLVESVARTHGDTVVSAVTVPITTLDETYAAHGIAQVHFLKIDVEGAEEQVLRGARFERVRPWIVVVEATRPNSPEPYFAHWEPLLTEHGYRFAYFDGLNRYYVAQEHAARAEAFAVPPNYFDGFVVAAQARAEESLRHHLTIIDGLDERLKEGTEVVQHHVRLIAEINGRVEAAHAEIRRHVDLLGDANAEIRRHAGLLDEANTERARLADVLGAANAEIQRLGARLSFAHDKIAWTGKDRDRYRRAYASVLASPSWRLTQPLRWGKRLDPLRRATAETYRAPGDEVSAPEPDTALPEAPPTPSVAAELPEHAIWALRALGASRDEAHPAAGLPSDTP